MQRLEIILSNFVQWNWWKKVHEINDETIHYTFGEQELYLSEAINECKIQSDQFDEKHNIYTTELYRIRAMDKCKVYMLQNKVMCQKE